MNKERKFKTNFNLTYETKQQVKAIASSWDRSISSTIRTLISKAFHELKGEN
jgi:hypothetical protein